MVLQLKIYTPPGLRYRENGFKVDFTARQNFYRDGIGIVIIGRRILAVYVPLLIPRREPPWKLGEG
jgi:hypothetical protein